MKPAANVVETSVSMSSFAIEVKELKTKVKELEIKMSKFEKEIRNIEFVLSLIPQNEFYVPESLIGKCTNKQQRFLCSLSKEELKQNKDVLQQRILSMEKQIALMRQKSARTTRCESTKGNIVITTGISNNILHR